MDRSTEIKIFKEQERDQHNWSTELVFEIKYGLRDLKANKGAQTESYGKQFQRSDRHKECGLWGVNGAEVGVRLDTRQPTKSFTWEATVERESKRQTQNIFQDGTDCTQRVGARDKEVARDKEAFEFLGERKQQNRKQEQVLETDGNRMKSLKTLSMR